MNRAVMWCRSRPLTLKYIAVLVTLEFCMIGWLVIR